MEILLPVIEKILILCRTVRDKAAPDIKVTLHIVKLRLYIRKKLPVVLCGIKIERHECPAVILTLRRHDVNEHSRQFIFGKRHPVLDLCSLDTEVVKHAYYYVFGDRCCLYRVSVVSHVPSGLFRILKNRASGQGPVMISIQLPHLRFRHSGQRTRTSYRC